MADPGVSPEKAIQQTYPHVESIVASSKFVVVYLLQQGGPHPGWRKAHIEGPMYLVRQRIAPRYRLIVKNQFNPNDLDDPLHPGWELDCQSNYVFYKVDDPGKRIRGLWFHDDAERKQFEQTLEKVLETVRAEDGSAKAQMPRGEPAPGLLSGMTEPPLNVGPAPGLRLDDPGRGCPPGPAPGLGGGPLQDVPMPRGGPAPGLSCGMPEPPVNVGPAPGLGFDDPGRGYPPGPAPGLGGAPSRAPLAAAPRAPAPGSIQLSRRNLRSALHAMAEDDAFIELIWQKLSSM
eukprot:TRINITY_DN16708_c0_g1_i1.p1 TRINITY_DN16708_c0_g1~~TRINITY_DN16708_c0_g1_i1.p1  ORF type:complete len:316 (-),score=41.01 TRINITY_DN16708_c0_g1_i1:106-972(-)